MNKLWFTSMLLFLFAGINMANGIVGLFRWAPAIIYSIEPISTIDKPWLLIYYGGSQIGFGLFLLASGCNGLKIAYGIYK